MIRTIYNKKVIKVISVNFCMKTLQVHVLVIHVLAKFSYKSYMVVFRCDLHVYNAWKYTYIYCKRTYFLGFLISRLSIPSQLRGNLIS